MNISLSVRGIKEKVLRNSINKSSGKKSITSRVDFQNSNSSIYKKKTADIQRRQIIIKNANGSKSRNKIGSEKSVKLSVRYYKQNPLRLSNTKSMANFLKSFKDQNKSSSKIF